MKNLTEGSVTKHVVGLSLFIGVSMLFQTLYFLAGLYWVGRLGEHAIAAVSLVGTIMFLVLALTQMLGVGTTTLVSHATGAGDKARANHAFNQAWVLSLIVGALFTVTAFALERTYVERLSADAETARLGLAYMHWFIPALGLQFLGVAMGSALRGIGVMKPTMLIQVGTVLLNIVLAPFLMFGWVTGRAFGVQGAAMASLISLALGIVIFFVYFRRSGSYLHFNRTEWKPVMKTWAAMVKVGLPAGGEFALTSVYVGLVYWIIRGFGPGAQAGFGIGGGVMAAPFLPGVAIRIAAGTAPGQNFGAR